MRFVLCRCACFVVFFTPIFLLLHCLLWKQCAISRSRQDFKKKRKELEIKMMLEYTSFLFPFYKTMQFRGKGSIWHKWHMDYCLLNQIQRSYTHFIHYQNLYEYDAWTIANYIAKYVSIKIFSVSFLTHFCWFET